MNPIIWLDVETTSLNTDHCALLQIGLRYTTEDFETLAETEILLAPPSFGPWNAFTRKMHTDSGLLDRCTREGVSYEEAHAQVFEFLDRVRKENPEKAIMAGNSLHFDRAVLRAQGFGVLVDEFFHHRVLDASFFKAFYMAQGWELMAENKAHTALADIDNSIATLRSYLSVFPVRG